MLLCCAATGTSDGEEHKTFYEQGDIVMVIGSLNAKAAWLGSSLIVSLDLMVPLISTSWVFIMFHNE